VNAKLPPLREVVARHGLSASKALGQNFLFDEQLLGRIAAVPGSLEGKDVYEVGPGPGGLTRALLRAGAQVTVVERDRRCLPALEELSEAFPGKLTIIEADALEVDLADVLPNGGHILSNLPYNIGTALLVKWLTGDNWPPVWKSLTLMFQREVADRIVAQPDTSAYGRLSILSQWRCDARLAMPVHRSAFTPPPKVMSAVVHLTPRTPPTNLGSRTIESLTAAAFGQRRKMLRQSLKSVPHAIDCLEELEIDSARRAETLSVEDFIDLGQAVTKAAKASSAPQ
jgi:16S rRNA (adenine1518-N6/adenine1519-N6)-dimethyltransferase